jgi:hypothetical protein
MVGGEMSDFEKGGRAVVVDLRKSAEVSLCFIYCSG